MKSVNVTVRMPLDPTARQALEARFSELGWGHDPQRQSWAAPVADAPAHAGLAEIARLISLAQAHAGVDHLEYTLELVPKGARD